jgi:hypothetical protein
MKKKILLIMPLLLLALVLTAKPSAARIDHFAWINPTIGEDLYYGRTVVAYKEGTPWNISLSVYNDF